MDQNANNLFGMNLRGGRNDRGTQQWQNQAQAEQFGQAQQFQMAGAAQREAIARRPLASDVGSSSAQQPLYCRGGTSERRLTVVVHACEQVAESPGSHLCLIVEVRNHLP